MPDYDKIIEGLIEIARLGREGWLSFANHVAMLDEDDQDWVIEFFAHYEDAQRPPS